MDEAVLGLDGGADRDEDRLLVFVDRANEHGRVYHDLSVTQRLPRWIRRYCVWPDAGQFAR